MIFAVAILITVGSLVFTLFIRRQDLPEPVPVSPVQHLEERKSRIYEGLRDLQFEYRLGKLSDEDYQKTKQNLQRELAQVLSEIDAVASTLHPPESKPVPPAQKGRRDGRTCPHCGATFKQPLRFCGECGKAMT